MPAVLKSVTIPDFGVSDEAPSVGPDIYAARLAAARERMRAAGYDVLVVYADREHSANLAYLTGFDPRFEEALLVVGNDGTPALLAGNECLGLAAAAPLATRPQLFQDFSLPGQPRGGDKPLAAMLSAEGIGRGRRVGVAGWKMFDDDTVLETPAYIVDTLRRLCGNDGLVTNAGAMFQDAADGLRVINEPAQLAAFEHAACRTSGGVRRLLENLRPGMRETEAARLLEWDGRPLSCHLMLSAGDRAALGLVSPGDRNICRGDPMTVAFGVWGALNCRAGFVVEDESELPAAIRDYVPRLVAPYFTAIAQWYQTLRVGVRGGDLYDAVRPILEDDFFGIGLNPGHQIHLDEWVNSPVFDGSDIPVRSGMALQCDVIPATGTAYFTTNIEDGVAVADTALRAELAEAHPQMWRRIAARRDFMREALGIVLDDSVLPFSNFPACLPPFLLRPHQVMALDEMSPD